MNFNLHLGDSWSVELLDEVTLEAQIFLTAFANDEAFSTNITLAFDNLIDTEIIKGLRQLPFHQLLTNQNSFAKL